MRASRSTIVGWVLLSIAFGGVAWALPAPIPTPIPAPTPGPSPQEEAQEEAQQEGQAAGTRPGAQGGGDSTGAPGATQQPEGEGATPDAYPGAGELREAMLRYFVNGLREHVGLSDEQVEAVLPHVEAMETARSANRREKAQLMREMRQLFRGGGTDDQLQSVLDRFEALENRQHVEQRQLQAAIDQELTVRQRIQFRMYSQRFRLQMRQRLRQLDGGGDEAGGWRQRGPGGRRRRWQRGGG